MISFKSAFLSWVKYLIPDKFERDPKFRSYLTRLSSIGLTVGGILAMTAIAVLLFIYVVVTGKKIVWTYVASIDYSLQVTISEKLLFFGVGIICVLLSRAKLDVQIGRYLGWFLMSGICFISVFDDVIRSDIAHSEGYLILILLIGVGAMPYRPWQVTILGIAVIFIYTVAVRWYPGGMLEVKLATQEEAYVIMIMATVMSTVITGYIYQARHRLFQARQKEITLRHSISVYAEELRQTNAKLKETQAHLVQSAKMAALGSLVAGVAHEINSPLGSIGANADTANRALALIDAAMKSGLEVCRDEKVLRAFDTLFTLNRSVKAAADRIDKIVTALRNFACLDEGEYQSYDLNRGIQDTLTLVLANPSIHIGVKKDFGTLPDLYCRPRQINQVFMNILTNAIEASPDQGSVLIETRHQSDCIIVKFSDSGRGIAQENLERIFEPGFTTKGRGVGTGLGLAICYRILDDHGGTITAVSQPGKGTTISIELPLNQQLNSSAL